MGSMEIKQNKDIKNSPLFELCISPDVTVGNSQGKKKKKRSPFKVRVKYRYNILMAIITDKATNSWAEKNYPVHFYGHSSSQSTCQT